VGLKKRLSEQHKVVNTDRSAIVKTVKKQEKNTVFTRWTYVSIQIAAMNGETARLENFDGVPSEFDPDMRLKMVAEASAGGQ